MQQSGQSRVDLTSLKANILSDLLRGSQETIKQRDSVVQKLQLELAVRNSFLQQASDITLELRQLFPEIVKVALADGVEVTEKNEELRKFYAVITTSASLPKASQQRIEDWLKVRLKRDAVSLSVEPDNQPNVGRKFKKG